MSHPSDDHRESLDTPPALPLPASFYRLTERLLRLPELGSVSFRGDADYELLRLGCAERARRHPGVESLPLDEGFSVNVLDVEGRWASAVLDDEDAVDDKRSPVPTWMYLIQFWDEGLGSARDFLIEAPPSVGLPLSEIMATGGREWKLIISFLEAGLATQGYYWCRHRDGFCVGVRFDQEPIRLVVEDWFSRESR